MKRLYVCCLVMITWIMSSSGLAQTVKIPFKEKWSRTKTMHVVAIGVSQFKDPFWPDLKWTVRDSREFLKAVGKGTGYRLETYLLAESEATPKRIQKTLSLIAKRAKSSDALIVYVSSHGTLDLDSDYQLNPVIVLSNSGKENLSKTGISQRKIRKYIKKIPARKRLLIFATCHSGLGKSKLSPEIKKLIAQKKGNFSSLQSASEGEFILAASSKNEPAIEDNRLRGDIYTHFFLEALDVYDRNKDGSVSALEAHEYAREKTYAFSKGRQRPTMEVYSVGDADLPLRGKRRRSPIPLLTGYDASTKGLFVSIDGKTKGKLPLSFPMREGDNQVYFFHRRDQKRPDLVFTVAAAKGEVIRVRDLFNPTGFFVSGRYEGSTWEEERKLAKIFGTALGARMVYSFGYQGKDYVLKAELPMPQDGEGQVRTELDASGVRKSYGLSFEYLWTLNPRVNVKPSLSIYNESASVTFEDKLEGSQISLSGEGMSYAIGVYASRRWIRGIDFQLGYSVSGGTLDFGEQGDISLKHRTMHAGIGYLIGAKGDLK